MPAWFLCLGMAGRTSTPEMWSLFLLSLAGTERVGPSMWSGGWKSYWVLYLPCESNSNLNCCFVLKCLSDLQICYAWVLQNNFRQRSILVSGKPEASALTRSPQLLFPCNHGRCLRSLESHALRRWGSLWCGLSPVFSRREHWGCWTASSYLCISFTLASWKMSVLFQDGIN